WQDPHCRGILCARGGFGGTRLLEDWHWPQATPKWLIGFSDITSLLWSLVGQGIAGVHGPLLTTLAAEPDWSQRRLFDLVAGRSLPPLQGQSWHGGVARGPLLPANLPVATHLLGTPHEPPLAGTILALEDVTEAPYRLDRMLTHWRMAGKLQQVAGIAIGRFSRCDPTNTAPSFTAMAVLKERLADLHIPLVADLPFGHDGENAALPVGIMATLDGDLGTLEIA
ncbi:MAG: LD-carboxypeptidase, partial [Cyanobacteria bacterium]|nr:LD-carboxypeptidase [Cyanobacteriota bacterium]